MVLGVSGQVRLKPVFPATEINENLKIVNVPSEAIILSRERISKEMVRLDGCVGRSAPLLFACNNVNGLLLRSFYLCFRSFLKLHTIKHDFYIRDRQLHKTIAQNSGRYRKHVYGLWVCFSR